MDRRYVNVRTESPGCDIPHPQGKRSAFCRDTQPLSPCARPVPDAWGHSNSQPISCRHGSAAGKKGHWKIEALNHVHSAPVCSQEDQPTNHGHFTGLALLCVCKWDAKLIGRAGAWPTAGPGV